MSQIAVLARGAIPTALTTAYTVAAGDSVILKSITFTNTNAVTADSVTVHIVPSGGSASLSNRIISTESVPSNTPITEVLNAVLLQGDQIVWLCVNGTTNGYISGYNGITQQPAQLQASL